MQKQIEKLRIKMSNYHKSKPSFVWLSWTTEGQVGKIMSVIAKVSPFRGDIAFLGSLSINFKNYAKQK